MKITRWEPKDIAREINSMRSDMEKLIDSFFGPESLFRREGKSLTSWSPSVEVIESEKDYTIRADLPGMETKDVEVEATPNSISIKGEYKSEKEEKSEGHFYSERSYGSFYRAIPLDEEIKLDGISSSMKNGLLEIKATKVVESKPKTQKVKVEISP